MDKEITLQFDRVHESIDKLAISVAGGFAQVDKRFDKVETDIADLRTELRAEIRSIRKEIEELPDVVDRIYGKTINSLFDRVRVIEKKLGIIV